VATKPKRISTWNECWNLSVKKKSESWQILNHRFFLSIIHATFWSLFCRNLVSSYEALRPRNRFWFYVFVQCAVFNQVQNTCIFRFSNFQRTKVQTHDFRTKTRVWSTSFFVSFWAKLCIFGSKQNHELGYVREVTFFKLGQFMEPNTPPPPSSNISQQKTSPNGGKWIFHWFSLIFEGVYNGPILRDIRTI
jgi:hypothetical protein